MLWLRYSSNTRYPFWTSETLGNSSWDREKTDSFPYTFFAKKNLMLMGIWFHNTMSHGKDGYSLIFQDFHDCHRLAGAHFVWLTLFAGILIQCVKVLGSPTYFAIC